CPAAPSGRLEQFGTLVVDGLFAGRDAQIQRNAGRPVCHVLVILKPYCVSPLVSGGNLGVAERVSIIRQPFGSRMMQIRYFARLQDYKIVNEEFSPRLFS